MIELAVSILHFSESLLQPRVFGTVAFNQFFVMISSEASSDLILHHLDPFL